MKKIMFNDCYGLTEAVLLDIKTQTRRIASKFISDAIQIGFNRLEIFNGKELRCYNEAGTFIKYKLPYQIGEVVAVAQSYKSLFEEDCRRVKEGKPMRNVTIKNVSDHPGWTNKMFVRADQMFHQIRIANVRVERLQDISDADCIAEGIVEACVSNNWGNSASHWEYNVPYENSHGQTKLLRGLTPQEAYAALIDRISGKGTWDSNSFCFVYDFELLK